MDVKTAIYDCMDKVTGLTKEDIAEMGGDVDFVRDGIMDSLTIVSVLLFIEKAMGTKMEISSFKIDDFRSIDTLAKAVDKVLAK